MPRFPTRYYGIALFILSMVFFSAMNVTIGALAGNVHPLQMVFLRNLFSFFLLLPFMMWRHGGTAMRTSRFRGHFMRAFIGLIAMESWFYSLTHMSVNTATALSFSAPLFSTILAVLLLDERIHLPRIVALLAGFAGVMVIINPAAEDTLSPYTFLVLFSTAMMAYTGIIVKKLTVTEPSWRIVLYMAGLMSILSFPLALTVWEPVAIENLILLVLIAVFSTFAQMSLTNALKMEQIVVLMPFEFMRLIFTALLTWIVFAEIITLQTIAGSVIIVCSAAFIAWRESLAKRARPVTNVTTTS